MRGAPVLSSLEAVAESRADRGHARRAAGRAGGVRRGLGAGAPVRVGPVLSAEGGQEIRRGTGCRAEPLLFTYLTRTSTRRGCSGAGARTRAALSGHRARARRPARGRSPRPSLRSGGARGPVVSALALAAAAWARAIESSSARTCSRSRCQLVLAIADALAGERAVTDPARRFPRWPPWRRRVANLHAGVFLAPACLRSRRRARG